MNKIYNQLLPVALFIEGGMHVKCSYSIATCIAVYLFNYHIFKRNESYCQGREKLRIFSQILMQADMSRKWITLGITFKVPLCHLLGH